MELLRCQMRDSPNQWCPLTDEFKATASFGPDPGGDSAPPQHQQKQQEKKGKGGIDELLFRGRHLALVNVEAVDARCSIADFVRPFLIWNREMQ